ncbi:MAG TPA: GntR family transcriptional regulator [Acidimicrobiales bacterium]|nr:GntR family transcriptional regulator [Acidimicrobiales bacterium]
MTITRYEATVQLIEAYIEENMLAVGDRLPTETEIAQMAGVSLITVRRAMTELAQAGFVRREQGRGTFVQARRIDAETTRLGGLSDTLGELISLTTEVLSVGRVDASSAQRSALSLDPGDKVWEVRRLRRIDGEPAVLEVACVPAARAPGLDKQVLRDPAGSLYRLLADRYGLEEAYEEQALVVRRPDPETRSCLGLTAQRLAVIITGTSYTRSRLAFDSFYLAFDALRFTFHLRSTPQDALLARTAGSAREGDLP